MVPIPESCINCHESKEHGESHVWQIWEEHKRILESGSQVSILKHYIVKANNAPSTIISTPSWLIKSAKSSRFRWVMHCRPLDMKLKGPTA